MSPPPRTVSLRRLLADALGTGHVDTPDVLVSGVAQHLDKVEPGHVFVARVGARVDGHAFAGDAVARGAVCVVGTRHGFHELRVPYVHVDDDRWAVSALAAAFHGWPSRDLTVAGVTGTDGKTTTSTLLHHVLQGDAPEPVASLLSSAAVRIGTAAGALEGHFTTPEATEVQAHLAAALDGGVRVAVVESSSHGASLQRLAHVEYDVMAWTNLSPEHLDHHGTFEAYRETKVGLVARAASAVLNRDDPAYADFAAAAGASVTYGLHPDADVRADAVVVGPAGLSFTLRVHDRELPARLPMVGDFNVHNALAALATAHALGVPFELGVERLASFAGVPGRMQLVATEPCSVVVDFAHTPGALTKALAAVTPGPGGRRIVVIGAAGERDPAKRGPLAAAALGGSDLAVFTEEDHRSESLATILDAMVAGAQAAGGVAGRDFVVVADRREAIATAVAQGRPGDVVLLAGKGHERTLERGADALPWDEAAEGRMAADGRAAVAAPHDGA